MKKRKDFEDLVDIRALREHLMIYWRNVGLMQWMKTNCLRRS